MPSVAAALETAVWWLALVLDGLGIVVIAAGTVSAAAKLPAVIRGRRRFTPVRLDFARYIALTLELQLASDVLRTAVAPSWDELGQLAAIAAIRTMLNYFLSREIDQERAATATAGGPEAGRRPGAPATLADPGPSAAGGAS